MDGNWKVTVISKRRVIVDINVDRLIKCDDCYCLFIWQYMISVPTDKVTKIERICQP